MRGVPPLTVGDRQLCAVTVPRLRPGHGPASCGGWRALARPPGGRNPVAGSGTLDHAGMLARPEVLGSLIEREWPLQVDRVTLFGPLANDVYRVDPGHFLKVYRHGWRTAGEGCLRSRPDRTPARSGIPVAAVTPRRDGSFGGPGRTAPAAGPDGPWSAASAAVRGRAPGAWRADRARTRPGGRSGRRTSAAARTRRTGSASCSPF